MTSLLLVLAVVCGLTGRVTPDRLSPGQTRQFDYGGDRYWVFIDWWGTMSYQNAETDCHNLHDAEVTNVVNDAQYDEIQTQVEGAIPGDWNEVLLWTRDSEASGTNVMLVIWRPGTGGPNKKENKAQSYEGHGYICRKPLTGNTYHFTYEYYDYWFNIDWWGTYDLATAESKCAEHDAKVVKIIDEAQLKEIETQVEAKISLDWNEVMLWTADSDQEGTNVMLVIWRPGTGGPNSKSNQAPTYKGHGYVCQKNEPDGTTYSYDFNGHKYYFFINWWGTSTYATAQQACKDLGASVASAADSAVYAEMQKQIEYRIPLSWHEVMLWTSDSNSSGTHVMVIVWRQGTGGPNKKESHLDHYAGHGYVCVAA